MVKKLTKHGNSMALVIDRPILDLLKIDAETPLEVSTDGKQLIIAPAKPSARRRKFDAAQEWAHKRYGKAFLKLAEDLRSPAPAERESARVLVDSLKHKQSTPSTPFLAAVDEFVDRHPELLRRLAE